MWKAVKNVKSRNSPWWLRQATAPAPFEFARSPNPRRTLHHRWPRPKRSRHRGPRPAAATAAASKGRLCSSRPSTWSKFMGYSWVMWYQWNLRVFSGNSEDFIFKWWWVDWVGFKRVSWGFMGYYWYLAGFNGIRMRFYWDSVGY